MQFRTVIDIKPFDRKIDHSSRILSLGSCFADNIARCMRRAKFAIEASPTGILFNPESIARTIERFADADIPTGDEVRYDGKRYFGYDFHSAFSNADRERTLDAMREAVRRGSDALREADTVIITFGTAWIYRLRENGTVVANCHKQPQSLFDREMLAADRIVRRYEDLIEGPLAGKHVVFTISPVRHLSDGAECNSLSKAVLRVAIGKLTEKRPEVDYFPSFEIVNDELRDYRFYADDMVHPSQTAVDYIWKRFGQTALTDEAQRMAERAERIAEAVGHRPFDPRGEAHRDFCRAMLKRIDELQHAAPQMNFRNETEYFNSFLKIN